jgi:hypothetical protein
MEVEQTPEAGGARRQHQPPAYRLIPAVLMKLAGEAYSEGAVKYNEGLFECNWKKGNEKFYAEAFDHVIEHLYKWWTIKTDPGLAEVLGYEVDECHLGHAAAGLGFLAYGDAMGFFNAARDPGAPGYQYPFVPEDIPEPMGAGPGKDAISDMIERGGEDGPPKFAERDSSLAETDEATNEQGPGENWFRELISRTGRQLKPAE